MNVTASSIYILLSLILTYHTGQVLEFGAISFVSKSGRDSFASEMDTQSCVRRNLLDPISTGDSFLGFQLEDLYDLFEIKVDGFGVSVLVLFSLTIHVDCMSTEQRVLYLTGEDFGALPSS